jgi:hypothetical protein
MTGHTLLVGRDGYRLYAADELGKDGYPPIWHQRLKHEVREAAGNRCVRCGHPYAKGAGEWSPCDSQCAHRGPYRYRHGPVDEWFFTDEDEPWIGEAGIGSDVGIEVQARWRILTVHHLTGNKADCRWWNLAALCQRCHLQIQGRVRMERTWPWEHSEWFKPYVAGYYAWTYLGEDLDRQQTEARLDELLALELVS